MIDTLSRLCGERWPFVMPPTMASCYCGMLRQEFLKIPELVAAKKFINGREKYFRKDLEKILSSIATESDSK